MKIFAKIISYLALILLIVPPILFYNGKIELITSKHCMFAATVIWFVSAPFWMDKKAN